MAEYEADLWEQTSILTVKDRQVYLLASASPFPIVTRKVGSIRKGKFTMRQKILIRRSTWHNLLRPIFYELLLKLEIVVNSIVKAGKTFCFQDSALSAVDKFGNSFKKMTRDMPTTSHPQCNLSPLLDRPVIRTREDSKDFRSRFSVMKIAE